MSKRQDAITERYDQCHAKQLGTMHERMKYLVEAAEAAELWSTHSDIWSAIHDLQAEVRYHEPAIPPFSQQPGKLR